METPRLKVALILPGLGLVHRGAETAFIELAKNLSRFDDLDIQLYGGGADVPAGLAIHTVPLIKRERLERFPQVPVFRSAYEYEEFSFILSLTLRKRREIGRSDVAIHCSFPFTNWFLRSLKRRGGPKSVFVTQNGDWTCRADSREYRTFRCDSLVCTKPEFYERHRNRYPSALIPNGVDPSVFKPRDLDPDFRPDPRIPKGMRAVLMASAFVPSKRVLDGIRAVAPVENTFMILAGDGPQRVEVAELCKQLLPGRHLLLGSVHRDAMPALYRQADAFLHMSQDESFGIVYLEAAASGLAQVVHRCEGTSWILGDPAAYADTSSVSEVSAALRGALGTVAAGGAREIGTRARARVLRDWTWEIQAAKYRNFLIETVRGPEGSYALSRRGQLQHPGLPPEVPHLPAGA